MAAVDRSDPDNLWATAELLRRVGPVIVTSAAIAEATHLLNNGPRALEALENLDHPDSQEHLETRVILVDKDQKDLKDHKEQEVKLDVLV